MSVTKKIKKYGINTKYDWLTMNIPKSYQVQREGAPKSRSVAQFLNRITTNKDQIDRYRHSYSMEGKNDDSGGNDVVNQERNKIRRRGRRRGRRRRNERYEAQSNGRTTLLLHDEEGEEYDPRDEDNPQNIDRSKNNHRRRRNKSNTNTNASNNNPNPNMLTNKIPPSIMYQPYSYTPLDNIDLWNWRDLMNDEFITLLRQNYKSTSSTSSSSSIQLLRLNVRESIGWTPKRMIRLFDKSTYLKSIDLSQCIGCNDRLLVSISRNCLHVTSLKISNCKSLTGKGVLSIVNGKSNKKLIEFILNGTNVSQSNDGGRLFIASLCINCVALKILNISNCIGIYNGAFENVLQSIGNILEDKIATAKLPSIQVFDASNLGGGSIGNTNIVGNSLKKGLKKGLSEVDLEGVLLCIHKNIRSLNLKRCYSLTDESLRSICHKKTSWGHTSHLGSIHVHTLILTDCIQLTDVSMGWISTGCPNIEILNISGCLSLTDWGLRALNRIPQLRLLDLSYLPKITIKGLKMLFIGEEDAPATTGSSLYDINLSNCINIHPILCLRLLSDKCKHLNIINVQSCINVELDWKVIQVLVKNCKYLNNLTIGPAFHERNSSTNGNNNKKSVSRKKRFPSLFKNGSSSSSILHWPSSRALEYLVKYLRTTLLHLDLSGTTVLTEALKELSTMNHLLTLNLKGCIHITNDIFLHLPNWKLQELNISYITAIEYTNGLENITPCEELKILKMNGCIRIKDNELLLLLLTNLSKLNTLEIQHCPLITTNGSLKQIISAKPISERIILTPSPKPYGFSPSTTRDASNYQNTYNIKLKNEQISSIKIQKWWRTYIRKILIIRKARIEKVKKKMAAINIQRVYRGSQSRYINKKILKYKMIVVRRLELHYIRRCNYKRKRKAVSFFKNRTLALYYHQWIQKMQELKHSRGEQSEYDRVQSAMKQLFSKLTDRYFRKWLIAIWTLKRRNGLLSKAMKFSGLKTSHRFLLMWHENVFHHVKRRRNKLSTIFMLCTPTTHDNTILSKKQLKESQQLWKIQLLKVWYRTWKIRALEQRQVLRKRARKVYKNYIKNVLRNWLIQANIIKENKRKFRAILQKMRHGKAIRMLHAWQDVAANLRDTRRALSLFTMRLQRSMIIMWKEMIVNIRYQKYLENRGHEFYVLKMKKIGTCRWYQYIIEKRLSKKRLLKALRLMRSRLVHLTIDKWKRFIIYKHNMLKKALGRARHSKLAMTFSQWYSLAAGRLERIRCAVVIQSAVRGWHYWKGWPEELLAYKWATGIVQAAWRGRVGRKLFTKQNRHVLLEIYKQQEAENDLMEIEDNRVILIKKIYWAASLVQGRWRGIQGRTIAGIARNKRKLLQAQAFNKEQERILREAEERKAQREEENMLRWLASMRLQSWWRGCLGKKAFYAAKYLRLLTQSAVLVQANYRALKARRKSAAKRRMKFDIQQSFDWKAQQGLAMRILKFKQRRTQRLGYRIMKPLGLLPISYNFSTLSNYGIRHEIRLDYILFKMILQREKDGKRHFFDSFLLIISFFLIITPFQSLFSYHPPKVVKTIYKNKSLKQVRAVRLKWSRNMDIAADRLVKQHDAIRIVRHFDQSLIGRTAYVLKIDETYGKRGMAEVKMDDDGTLQYVPIISELGGLQADGNGCVKIKHRKFLNMPGNVTTGWRHNLRLLAEVSNSILLMYKYIFD